MEKITNRIFIGDIYWSGSIKIHKATNYAIINCNKAKEYDRQYNNDYIIGTSNLAFEYGYGYCEEQNN